MTSPKIHTTMVGFNTVLTIKEALTYKTCEELQKVFDQLTKESRNRIVIDFRAIPFLDSEALELLLTMHESLVNSGGILKLFGLNGTCRDILITTRLVNVFHVYQDMPEALRSEV